MKAYMSVESSFRSYCELGSTDEHGTPLETVAEREARRILAETEPRLADACTAHYAPEWGCYLPDRTGAGAPCNPWDFTEALAESLAAFVAE